ncbi:MAG: TadE family protein [Acidobacteriota bacterium]
MPGTVLMMLRWRSSREVRLCRAQRTSGQSMVETCVSLTIVMMIVLALIHLSMLAVTRHVTNYAAFAGARVAMYGGRQDARPREAGTTVLRILPWGGGASKLERVGDNYRVELRVPFAYPLFNNAPGGRTVVRSEAPVCAQPDIPETGDNAAKD